MMWTCWTANKLIFWLVLWCVRICFHCPCEWNKLLIMRHPLLASKPHKDNSGEHVCSEYECIVYRWLLSSLFLLIEGIRFTTLSREREKNTKKAKQILSFLSFIFDDFMPTNAVVVVIFHFNRFPFFLRYLTHSDCLSLVLFYFTLFSVFVIRFRFFDALPMLIFLLVAVVVALLLLSIVHSLVSLYLYLYCGFVVIK